ncbi:MULTISPECIES: DinB family protein [Gordonia]|uniref:DinB-like domain-containing protein n=2 Tax=Gordonia TaxID=2053 RepID=L7LQ01_9ACTN|nr:MULTISPECIES: DinB family protein [Gordonia]AUH69689.1 methyltransferase type 12 [Gordonia sp. YC-JH1]KJR09345.1 methyltransferase type 12 [Gordonia sihwensis]KXT57507.1 methyltransferase type 12 [Gordonia sp. QH-12]MBY4570311.1 methyltransferase type 12 [Gordonia sihwensis]GAC62133.1 hypothetical protein GSI01S_29_00210 [Gordonia sihwensis NBRC 108236]
MTFEPDGKDWTWVTRQRCPACGFDPATVRREDVADRIAASITGWNTVLARADVRVRPDDHTWSALEYACHVRDVGSVMTERLDEMLRTQPVCFDDWDQDAAAVEADYGSQSPDAVSSQLTAAVAGFAEMYRLVREDDWSREGLRGDGTVFTVETFAMYVLHELEHHRTDVGLPARE